MSLKHLHDSAEYLDLLSVSKNREWCNHGRSHIDVNPSVSLCQVCCLFMVYLLCPSRVFHEVQEIYYNNLNWHKEVTDHHL